MLTLWDRDSRARARARTRKGDVRIALKEQREFDRSLYSRKCIFWSMENITNDVFSNKNPRSNSVPSLSPSFYQLGELEFSKGCLHPFAGFPKKMLATSNFAMRNQKLQKESEVLRSARVVAVISKPDSSEHEAFFGHAHFRGSIFGHAKIRRLLSMVCIKIREI